MFGLDRIDMQRLMISALGAVALSAASFGAAVAPVKATTAAPSTPQHHRFAVK